MGQFPALSLDPVDPTPQSLKNPNLPVAQTTATEKPSEGPQDMVRVLVVQVFDVKQRLPHVLKHVLHVFRPGGGIFAGKAVFELRFSPAEFVEDKGHRVRQVHGRVGAVGGDGNEKLARLLYSFYTWHRVCSKKFKSGSIMHIRCYKILKYKGQEPFRCVRDFLPVEDASYGI